MLPSMATPVAAHGEPSERGEAKSGRRSNLRITRYPPVEPAPSRPDRSRSTAHGREACPRQHRADMPPGRGLWIDSGRVATVQVPLVDTELSPDSDVDPIPLRHAR